MKNELIIADLRDLETDGAPVLPLLRATGPAPRLRLAGPGAFAPGAYRFALHARSPHNLPIPKLSVCYTGGGEREVSLQETISGEWRALIVTHRVASNLAIDFGPGAELILGGATIEFDEVEAARSPTLRQGLLALGRSVFHKLPAGIRRLLLASPKRAIWLRRARVASNSPASEGGRFTAAVDPTPLQADFENRFAAARGAVDPAFTSAEAVRLLSRATGLFAFYLPQFHPIPENDAWWGRGFTEWSNVAKAIPQFVGHYQPRLPGELGFYDLRTPGVVAEQAQLARAYGLRGFCFHYYWFAGKRLLEKPLDAFLTEKSIELEFCLCWANENWTRRWDGNDRDVLIAQHHSRDDHERVFDDMTRYIEDSRYLRVEGKPFIVVYRPEIIGDAVAMTDIWRERAARLGWPGLMLAATTAFRFSAAASLGFDALVEFPPHGLVTERINGRVQWLNPVHAGSLHDYGAVSREQSRRADAARATPIPVFPGVMPGWDNEARRPGRGVIFHASTPGDYGRWLAAAIARAERTLPAKQRLVFINAWNEWAEGAYLEPDRTFGRAYLAETARVVGEAWVASQGLVK